jgi:hypothetical protein
MDNDFADLKTYRSAGLINNTNSFDFVGYRDYLIGRGFGQKHVSHIFAERWSEPGGPDGLLCSEIGSRIHFVTNIPLLDEHYDYRDSCQNEFNPGRASMRLFVRQLLLDSYQKLYGRGLGYYYSTFPGW